MTPSLGFNKPESANFIFECMQYLMPEEGGKIHFLLCIFFFYACAEPFAEADVTALQQMRDCGEDSRQQCLDIFILSLTLKKQQ